MALRFPHHHHVVLAITLCLPLVSQGQEQRNEDQVTQGPPRYDDFLALGAVTVPEYEGSEDQQLVPLLFGQIRFGANRSLAIQGTGLQLNLLNSSEWSAGPAVNFAFGRDDSVANETIALLEEVDTAIEAGAFVSRAWNGLGHPSASLSAGVTILRDVANAHDGWQAQANISYGRNYAERWRLNTSLGFTVVDDNFADTYFSVSGQDALVSGLATYGAQGGLKDIGASATVTYQLSRRWSAVGFVSYRRLVSDAVDSPIVAQEGDANQVIGALGVGFAF